MNKIYITIVALAASVAALVAAAGCDKADPEFVHTNNTISAMSCKNIVTAEGIAGIIREYTAAGEEVTGRYGIDFTQEQVEGGYGTIEFVIPKNQADLYDLTAVFLTATLTSDEFIHPGLTGKHDISGAGMKITVRSGVGTTRAYTITGRYATE